MTNFFITYRPLLHPARLIPYFYKILVPYHDHTMNKLSITLAIAAFTVLASCTSYAQQVDLSADEFEKAMLIPGAQVLDVRTAEE